MKINNNPLALVIVRDQLKAGHSVGLGRVAPKITERGSSADDPTRVGDSLHRRSRTSFRSINKSDHQQSFSHSTLSGKARSRKPEVSRVSRHFAEGEARASIDTFCRADGVSGGRGLRKCIPGKFQLTPRARRLIHAIGGSRDSQQYPRCWSITWHTPGNECRIIRHLRNHSCNNPFDLTERN